MAIKEKSKEQGRVEQLLQDVVEHFDKEDRAARDRQMRKWKQLKYLWDGIQRTWYSEVAHDWRVYEPEQYTDDSSQSYYDKPVNVLKAYLESIIAALSVTVPPIKCYPDDAESGLDLSTAKAGDKIANLVYRHNNVQLLWLHALFIFCTEGLIFCYNYTDEDEKYGTYNQKNYEDQVENRRITSCPLCGMEVDNQLIDSQKNKFDPGDEDVKADSMLQGGIELCPNCLHQVVMNQDTQFFNVTRLVGESVEPKSRQCLEVFGGLNVKVPIWAKKQKDIPYLFYCYEDDTSNIIEEFPELHDSILSGEKGKSGGAYNQFEQWARISTQYRGEFPINLRTVRKCWLRCSAFNILTDEDDIKFLKTKFPDGAYVCFINDIFASACNEALDDHWTLSVNPLSDYLHHDPLALLLTSIQDITNDMISLVLQTMEHGIAQTFVDKGVLDLEAYSQTEVLPGGIYPAVPKSGKSMQDAFFQTRTATLSQEVLPFAEKIQTLGQLVSGALPSLFGGALSESNTASEYSMSRAQALQRLQNTWKMMTMWWKDIFGKVIPAYIENLHEDEKEVTKDTFGGFMNSYIRLAEVEGKIGKVELEANETMPMTWQQTKDVVMSLIQTQSPEILQMLGMPENIPVMREALGLTDFFIPGEDDRIKQYEEIGQLTSSEPLTIPPSIDPMTAHAAPQLVAQNPQMAQMMQPQEVASVQIDPLVDNHAIHLEICKAWAVSEAGRVCKMENPDGYKNVLLHAQQHMQAMQPPPMMQLGPQGSPQPNQGPPQSGQGPQQGAPPSRPRENTQAPIQNERDINVAQ